MEEFVMKFDFNNVESERAKNIKFADDNGISHDKMEEIYQKIYAELPEDLTGEKRELRALRKTRGSLKRRANSTGTQLDGFIIMRFKDKDFEANAWNKVNKYVEDNGIDKAKEEGMVNANGDYIHTKFTTSFATQHGKKIDKENVRGEAVGIVVNEKGEQELRFLSIGKYSVFDNIPLCRELTLNVKEGTSPGPLYDKNIYFLNGADYASDSTNAYYSDEDFNAYTEIISKLCGDIMFDTIEDIEAYARNNRDNRYNFIGVVVSSVERIGNALADGAVPIELEVDTGAITTWASKNVFKDLNIEDGIPGVALVNTYVNSNDEVGCRIGGFLPYY